MDVSEPRARRRGFFLHSEPGEPDTGEHENPEGFVVRVRITRPIPRRIAGMSMAGGRSLTAARASEADDSPPQIRSGSVTGSRQRAD